MVSCELRMLPTDIAASFFRTLNFHFLVFLHFDILKFFILWVW